MLLSEGRSELLLSWRHSGFSVHNRVRLEPEDQSSVERLARSIMRPPISTEHDVVDAILRHLKRKEERRERAPPS